MATTSLSKFAYLGVLVAFIGLLFATIILPPPYQSVYTSKWPQEAVDILMENYPHGVVTPDQHRRIAALNETLKFERSFSEALWLDVLGRWWIFFFLVLIASLYFLVKKSFGVVEWGLLSLPSLGVLAFALVTTY